MPGVCIELSDITMLTVHIQMETIVHGGSPILHGNQLLKIVETGEIRSRKFIINQ